MIVRRVGPEAWKRLAESLRVLASVDQRIREIRDKYGLHDHEQESPMSAITTLAGLMPLVQQAAATIAAFQGTAQQAATTSKIADAVEVLNAGAQLAQSFSRGIDVTPDDVRVALAGMDDALDSFDKEIARQKQGQP